MAGYLEDRLMWYKKHRQEYGKMIRIFQGLDALSLVENPSRDDVLKFNDLFQKFIDYTTDLTFRNDCL